MSKKQEQQNEIDRLRNDMGRLQARNAFLSREVARRNRALYAGTRRYMRQAADLVAAADLTKVQRQVIERLRGQLEEERASWSRVADAQEQTVEHLREELRLMTEHRDELQEFADALRADLDRHRRALEAGSRRYEREIEVRENDLWCVQQEARRHAEQLEDAGQEQALLQLQATMEAREARKLAGAAQRRADKLAAKLVHRAGELGHMRRVYADMFAGRTRALEDAGKRTAGLKASLRKAKAQTRAERKQTLKMMHLADTYRRSTQELRQKLRESNKAVLMEALGGGLEVHPLSGRQHEDTTGYSPAALRAVKGIQ